MKYISDFINSIKFFLSFYFKTKFNYKINKILDKKIYINLQNKYLLKGELSQILDFEKNNNYTIDRDWLNNLALHTQVTLKKSEINYEHGKILYSSLSNYLTSKEKKIEKFIIFETGTAKGFSSLCMSKALNDTDQNGTIYSVDLVPHQIKSYWNVIDDYDGKKTREELLKNWKNILKNIIFITGNINSVLNKIDLKYINFAFIDSIHTSTQIIKEFKFISKRQSIGDIIVLDDIDTNYDKNNEPNSKYLLEKFPNYHFEFIESFYPRCYAIAKRIY